MKKNITLGIVLLLIGVAGGLMLPKIWTKSSGTPIHGHKGFYQCAMHPQIVSDKPGDCPICHMKLQYVEGIAGQTDTPKERKILFYRNPMQPDVTSPVPTKDSMGMDYIPVYSDESAGKSDVPGHATFSVPMERQQLIGVKTSAVERRELSRDIRAVGKVAYDPELYNALAEYREALAAQNKSGGNGPATGLLKASQLRMQLLGFSKDQLSKLNAESDNANLLLPGKNSWIYADVYEYEVELLKPGQTATVSSPAVPGRYYTGKVAAVEPVLNAATRTVRVRIQLSEVGGDLRPDSFVDVVIHVPLGRGLAVPENAVLDTGDHQVVFVRKGDTDFEPRSVQLGRQVGEYYEILSGVQEGETVVTSANFLIDSESRFKAALADYTPAGGKK